MLKNHNKQIITLDDLRNTQSDFVIFRFWPARRGHFIIKLPMRFQDYVIYV